MYKLIAMEHLSASNTFVSQAAIKSNTTSSACVCILAYNEERHIRTTIKAICESASSNTIPVYVYANGCTDKTCEIVTQTMLGNKQVGLCQIAIASKPNAWNCALLERTDDILIFSDGDVLPEPGAAGRLVEDLLSHPTAVIATCRQVPVCSGLGFQNKLVGFMQEPLVQTFLAGGFYAIRREAMINLLSKHGLDGLPAGVAGEDAFLYYLVGSEGLVVSEAVSAYYPPNFLEYCKYLARIRWQNEQIRKYWGNLVVERSLFETLKQKWQMCPSYSRLPFAVMAVMIRYLFKLIMQLTIDGEYYKIGPVRGNGADVLRVSTRSQSTK